MGRLEKQIIVGALGLVGLLLAIVVLRGLKPHEEGAPGMFINLDDPATGAKSEETTPQDSGLGGFLPLKNTPEVDLGAGQTPPPVVDEPVVKEEPKRTPVAPPKVTPVPASPRLYTIKKGDILGSIAQRELGSTRFVKDIQRANPGIDESHLIPGETLVIPVVTPPQASAAAATPELPAGARLHQVGPGDSLWSIAEKYYGNGSEMGRLVAANAKLLPEGKETVLRLGTKLVIPR